MEDMTKDNNIEKNKSIQIKLRMSKWKVQELKFLLKMDKMF